MLPVGTAQHHSCSSSSPWTPPRSLISTALTLQQQLKTSPLGCSWLAMAVMGCLRLRSCSWCWHCMVQGQGSCRQCWTALLLSQLLQGCCASQRLPAAVTACLMRRRTTSISSYSSMLLLQVGSTLDNAQLLF